MSLFDEALQYAMLKHSGQRRRMANVPYILHPLEVATIIGTMTDDEEILAAGLLHDTVEDADATLEEIREKFGKRVSLLVMTETEDKREGQAPEKTWAIRKEESLLILQNTKDIGVKMLWLGDKLSNMRSFYREYQKLGDSLWQNFHQKDPKKQAKHYRMIAAYLADLKEYDAYQEYVRLTNIVFQNIKEEEI